jgi:hypothetical protein
MDHRVSQLRGRISIRSGSRADLTTPSGSRAEVPFLGYACAAVALPFFDMGVRGSDEQGRPMFEQFAKARPHCFIRMIMEC